MPGAALKATDAADGSRCSRDPPTAALPTQERHSSRGVALREWEGIPGTVAITVRLLQESRLPDHSRGVLLTRRQCLAHRLGARDGPCDLVRHLGSEVDEPGLVDELHSDIWDR